MVLYCCTLILLLDLFATDMEHSITLYAATLYAFEG